MTDEIRKEAIKQWGARGGVSSLLLLLAWLVMDSNVLNAADAGDLQSMSVEMEAMSQRVAERDELQDEENLKVAQSLAKLAEAKAELAQAQAVAAAEQRRLRDSQSAMSKRLDRSDDRWAKVDEKLDRLLLIQAGGGR